MSSNLDGIRKSRSGSRIEGGGSRAGMVEGFRTVEGWFVPDGSPNRMSDCAKVAQ